LLECWLGDDQPKKKHAKHAISWSGHLKPSGYPCAKQCKLSIRQMPGLNRLATEPSSP